MTDQLSAFSVGLDGDASSLSAAIKKITGEIRTAASEIERSTKNIELFKGTEDKVRDAEKAFVSASEKVAAFREQMVAVQEAGPPTREQFNSMAVTLKTLTQEAKSSATELDKQRKALTGISTTLTKAGVDVTKLADEERRLATETAAATKAAAEQQARQTLGVKSAKETSEAIAKLTAAYNTLKSSGAPLNELAQAQSNLLKRTAELRQGQGGLVESFSTVRTAALGVVGAFAGVALAAKEAAAASIEFEKATTQIGTVSNLTEGQVDELTEGIRTLAQTAGFDLKEGLTAAYDLLRQGVPAGNILEVLATADDAAKAGLTDLGTTAKLAGTLVRGFGVEVSQIKPTMDALFTSAKNGGATLAEFSAGLGEIGPIARKTNTPVEQVAAAIQVMTRAGLDAPAAFSQLNQIMTRLAQPATIKRLRELGIESGSLVDTLRQISERNLSLGSIIELGVSSARAAAGVAALTADSHSLAQAMDLIGNSAGAIDKAASALNRLQADAVDRLVASLKDLQITLGKIVAPSAQAINTAAQLTLLLNNLTKKVEDLNLSMLKAGGSTARVADAAAKLATLQGTLSFFFGAVGQAAKEFNEDLVSTGKVVADTEDQVSRAAERNAATSAKASEALAKLREDLGASIESLEAVQKLVSQSAQTSIDSINTAAQHAIAGLDKLTNTQKQIAEQTITIQTEAAAKRLEVLKTSAADAVGIVEAEGKRRLELAKQSGKDLTKVEQDIAKDKRDVFLAITKQFQTHLGELLKLETDHLNDVKKLTQQRADFNLEVERTILDIRGESLSALDVYVRKVKEVDDTISKARQAAAEGDLKAVETFTKKAIELAGGIAKKVEENGLEVVGQYEAQGIAIDKVRKAQAIFNEAIDDGVTSSREAAKATALNIEETQKSLDVVKKKLDEVNRIIEKGIEVTITTNAKEAVDEARKQILSLNGLNTESTHTIHQRTVEERAGGGLIGGSRGTPARGGPVRRFASGGTVFRSPGWSKVPGSGNGDTVPAALKAGSYVVKKSASRYYGDGLMSRVARGYASGGRVSPLLGGKGSGPLAGGTATGLLSMLGGGGPLFELIRVAFRVFQPLIDGAKTLPRSSTGQNLADYLAAVLNTIRSSSDVGAAGQLLDNVASIADNLAASIVTAHKFNVPIVMGAFAPEEEGGVFKNTPGSALYDALVDTLRKGGAGFAQGTAGRFASGGQARGSDVIPAMLTPGEFVVRKPAVDRFGVGLLNAVNRMTIPRETLARIVAGPVAPQRTRYFEEGGMVTASSSMSPGSSTSSATQSGGGDLTVNLNASLADLYSTENIERFLIPKLKDFQRRRA